MWYLKAFLAGTAVGILLMAAFRAAERANLYNLDEIREAMEKLK